MLFPTIEFAIFFFVVFVAYWSLSKSAFYRKLFLVSASYFFYGYWDVRFLSLLFTCSFVNFILGHSIYEAEGRKKKLYLTLGVVFNLGLLGFFKYFGFFTSSFLDVLGTFGFERDFALMEIILPVGISFFVFQGISYIIDIYRKEIPPSHSLLNVMLYISFFPQLVAGPIVRATTFFSQVGNQPNARDIPAGYAGMLIIVGLFKKVLIANYLATELVDPAFSNPSEYGSIDMMFAVYGYAIQIYCDFSAYSDIAIGVAALLGYQFPKNFNQPYRAHSLQNFWRRWHISLSTWLRDYLYIPLGGSRKGRLMNYRNLFLTMFLGGLWHGAAWNFVIWGTMHGATLGIEKFLRETTKIGEHISKGMGIFLTFHFVCLTWIFFRADTFNLASEVLSVIASFSQGDIALTNGFLLSLILLGFATQFVNENAINKAEIRFANWPVAVQGLALGIAFVVLSAISPIGVAPFIYFQF